MAVLTGPVADFLETGCALIAGLVDGHGAPFATRGWGLEVLDPSTVRLLAGTGDLSRIDGVTAGSRIAITGADVATLRSMQIKGRIVAVGSLGLGDAERHQRYLDDFFAAVSAADGYGAHLLARLVPAALVSLEVAVDELFDQTPGPGAGALVARSAPS